MTRLTPAPTMPTSNEIWAPYITRVKTSRPWTSVPNQCFALGEANWSSDSASGWCGETKGQINTSKTIAARNQALIRASRLRWKRRHARWLGERCELDAVDCAGVPGSTRNSERSTFGSLILHPWIEQRVEEVHEQVQHDEQCRIHYHQADHHRVVTVQRPVHDEHADAGNLEDRLDDERAGQQISEQRAG